MNMRNKSKNNSADFTTIHGVFMSVFNSGVLLAGASGIGKSELALGLLGRGHSLIADDVVELKRDGEKILGHCPPLLQGFLEVRGLGILDIPAIYGKKSIKPRKPLSLIIRLAHYSPKQLQQIDRVEGLHKFKKILSLHVPEVTIPVISGRNLAVLAECAVRNHQLKLKGYDAGKKFIEQHQRYMTQSTT